MPRIQNYPSLKTQVLQLIEREEDPQAIDVLYDGWVSLCENDFWTTLRAPYLERFSLFTYDAANTATPKEFEYLPPSYVEAINLADLSNGNNLDPIGVSEIVEARKLFGMPSSYIIRGYTITVLPVPTAPINMELTYYSRSEPLTVDEPVNDIIDRDPMIYYFGVLKQAALSYGEMQNYQMWDNMMKMAVDKTNDSATGWRRSQGKRVRVRI